MSVPGVFYVIVVSVIFVLNGLCHSPCLLSNVYNTGAIILLTQKHTKLCLDI